MLVTTNPTSRHLAGSTDTGREGHGDAPSTDKHCCRR
jgi:hypothetical protein